MTFGVRFTSAPVVAGANDGLVFDQYSTDAWVWVCGITALCSQLQGMRHEMAICR
jgi:hypothetical protein